MKLQPHTFIIRMSNYIPFSGIVFALLMTAIVIPGSVLCQLTRLTATDLSLNGHFGREIDVYHEHIIVTEPNFGDTSSTIIHQGRAHIFQRQGDTWIHEGMLDNVPTKAYSHFGHDVSLYESDMAISAPGLVAGNVFMYSRVGTDWQFVQQITVPAALHREGHHIQYGEQIALQEEWLVISAPGYPGTDDPILRTGTIFIYKKLGSIWAFHQMLLPPDLSKSTQFGNKIVLTSSAMLISAVKGEGGAEKSGVVFLYRLEGDLWVPDYTFINPSSRPHELFGADVDMTDDIIVIGTPMHTEDDSKGPHGAAHVYQRFGNTWIRTAFLEASDGKRNDMFGAAVAVADGNIFIGAPRHDEPGKVDAGKVYHFDAQNSLWSEKTSYSAKAEDLQAHMHFGGNLRLHGNHLVISAHLMNNSLEDSGIAYVTDIDEITSTGSDPYTSLQVKVDPNPVKDIMYITLHGEWDQSVSITIYAQDGHPVDRRAFSNHPGRTHSMEVSDLIPGIYFLQVHDGANVSVHKWIKI